MQTARASRALVIAAVAALVTVAASLAFGSSTLGLGQVWDGLVHGGDGDAAVVVRDLRVPRTVVGLAVGAALGLAGALMQALTRNPLADPGLLGVEAGAAAAAVTGIAVLGLRTPGSFVLLALIGAGLAAAVVHLIGSRTATGGPIRLVLAGAAVTAVLIAYVEGVILLDAQAFSAFRAWRYGSIAGRDLGDLDIVGPVMVAGAVLAVLISRRLNAIALGEDTSRALGVDMRRTRTLGALAITLLCGGATALAGPVGFVGLTVPYVARKLVGVDQRLVLLMSIPLGAVLVLGTDTLGRVIGRPGETSVGIVMAAVGGLVFVSIVRRGRIPQL